MQEYKVIQYEIYLMHETMAKIDKEHVHNTGAKENEHRLLTNKGAHHLCLPISHACVHSH